MKKRTQTVAMAAPRTKDTSGLMLLTSPPFMVAGRAMGWVGCGGARAGGGGGPSKAASYEAEEESDGGQRGN
jgi:hypothetical protein